jgi:hypothetical protein
MDECMRHDCSDSQFQFPGRGASYRPASFTYSTLPYLYSYLHLDYNIIRRNRDPSLLHLIANP